MLASAPAAAVGLGPVIEQSALGQPLRVVVPVIAGAGDELAAECFKLAATETDADGVPRVVFGRVSLEHAPSGARLVVSHPRPVNDPVLRLALQAGCDTTVRREYTLLMDLPPIDVPLTVAEVAVPAEVAASPAPVRPARPAPDAARGAGRAGTAATGDAPPAPRKAAPTKARGASKGAARRTPPVASTQPRLKLSNAPPAAPGAGLRSGTAAQQAQTEQEIANAIEAETVVVQARLAELTAMVEKLQQELRESESADRAAERAAKAPPPPPPAPPIPWWEANWPILAAIVGMAILVAGALLWKRRRDASTRGADWQATSAVGPSGADTISRLRREQALRSAPAGLVEAGAERGPATRTKGPAPVARPTAPPVARPAPPPVTQTPAPPVTRTAAPPATRDTAGALAVSELSQVTEEARVYVALGHPDRAIGVLNEHIKRLPRSMPAAWLMLLGLYHANGRRQEFRRVAEEFHVHFNVQTPLWDGFAVSESGEGGLESFPQIEKQVVDLWGQPACRVYLERLLYDNREGRRMGFPLAAYSDILLLLQISDVPPEIDIDRDLANAGRLELGRTPAATMPQPPKPAARPAVRLPPVLRSPPAADPARPRKPMPPDPAAQARAPQSPISFELDLDRDAGNPGKKTS